MQAKAVVLVLGDRSGMTPGCTTGEARDSMGLKLPGVQAELAEAILATEKPVIIVLAYYNCPMLCSLVLNGLTAAVQQSEFTPGKDFAILTVSYSVSSNFRSSANASNPNTSSVDRSASEIRSVNIAFPRGS